MDDEFNDALIRRGIGDAPSISALSDAADAIGSSVAGEQVARLVALAHGDSLDRTADEWFWRPLREACAAYPSDPAEVHADVADACVRQRIVRQDDVVAAVLVRLAGLADLSPASTSLHLTAARALEERTPTMPTLRPMSHSTMEATVLKGFPEDGSGAVPADSVRAALTTLITQVKRVAAHADSQAQIALEWARTLNEDRGREIRCIDWMLAGVRQDGSAWTDLPPASVATGLAAELSALIDGVPAIRHEALLARMVSLAGVSSEPITLDADHASPPSPALKRFTPFLDRLSGGPSSPAPAPPMDIAHRLLWEHTAVLVAGDE